MVEDIVESETYSHLHRDLREAVPFQWIIDYAAEEAPQEIRTRTNPFWNGSLLWGVKD
ncbi:MAG: hypothetical protein NZX77_11010 [Polyangiaceae bacterium]|nr:hypothetical protein [Polyangiaceae bacterium]